MTHKFKLDGIPDGALVAVAMSGGVDSSVTAALMVEAGYQVIGITLQLYDHGQMIDKKGACCAGQDIYDARTVADKLGFPHYVLDYESIFKQSVMEAFNFFQSHVWNTFHFIPNTVSFGFISLLYIVNIKLKISDSRKEV